MTEISFSLCLHVANMDVSGFHIFGVVIIMNIVVASIIDTFVNEWQESDGGASSKKWGSESTTVTFKNRKYIVRENVTLY